MVSGRSRTPRESASLRRGLRTVRRGSGVLTLDQSGREGSLVGASGGLHDCCFVSSLMRRRRDLALRRMSRTSCLTVLGQRCLGSVPLPRIAGGLRGNMVDAVCKASSRMAWISLARPSIDDSMHRESIVSHAEVLPGPWPSEVRREWPIALTSEVIAMGPPSPLLSILGEWALGWGIRREEPDGVSLVEGQLLRG